jgi:hypothetical protein
MKARLLAWQVMSRLESARAICDCMAALVQGDLHHTHSQGTSTTLTATQVDDLLPLSPSGAPPPQPACPPLVYPHRGVAEAESGACLAAAILC